MTGADDYRAAIRWYPEEWRDAHGEALVGVLLDRDEAVGRAGPTRADRREIAVAGLREHALAPLRRGRRLTTSAGLILIVSGAMIAQICVEFGRRRMYEARTGNYNLMLSSSGVVFDLLLVFLLVGVAWMLAGAAVQRRGGAKSLGLPLAAVISVVTLILQSIDPGVAPRSEGYFGGNSTYAAVAVVSGVALVASAGLLTRASFSTGLVARRWRWVVIAALAIGVATFILMQTLAGAGTMPTPDVVYRRFFFSLGEPAMLVGLGVTLILGVRARPARGGQLASETSGALSSTSLTASRTSGST